MNRGVDANEDINEALLDTIYKSISENPFQVLTFAPNVGRKTLNITHRRSPKMKWA